MQFIKSVNLGADERLYKRCLQAAEKLGLSYSGEPNFNAFAKKALEELCNKILGKQK